MQLQEIVYSQGFGTRRICAGLIQHGHVSVGGKAITDPTVQYETHDLRFCVDGVSWPYREKAYLMLHKPAATECSRKPSAYPSIYTLLPACLRQRPQKGAIQGVQAVGRLDQDTTGLLLLTDDGQFIHRMSSPRNHVPKVYQVVTRHPVAPSQIARLLAGVVLDDDPRPVRAADCGLMPDGRLQLTLTQGKYHQVKRMIAAVGNRVEHLHRSRIGALALPSDLPAGHWRWLSQADLDALRS